MKIVIDIPEEEYNTGQLVHYFGCYSDKLDLVIYNGTPLPEHHGRLIDADALTEKAPENKEHLDVLAPTIIEGSDDEWEYHR